MIFFKIQYYFIYFIIINAAFITIEIVKYNYGNRNIQDKYTKIQ